uniref:Uncharacterized protein n=1 Tax=uncultured bacterium A1Q1_fos_500 TaxID=1256579 RepID=L7VSG6_9BACT|nr:hypothetical protein [uncultured bacterium A1Q1_fos_500]
MKICCKQLGATTVHTFCQIYITILTHLTTSDRHNLQGFES